MNRDFIRWTVCLVCAGASSSAQACGYTGGAGVEGLFSLDNPLDIAILALGFGALCAAAPVLLQRMGWVRREPE